MNREFRQTSWDLRQARLEDGGRLDALIRISARELQKDHYSHDQIEAALGPVFGVDRQLIEDRTYFVIEHRKQPIACGGWSRRKSQFGGDASRSQHDTLLDPATEAARIRAFFVHPDFARRGLGSAIMTACEKAIRTAGFQRVEIVATLPGELLYQRFSYSVAGRFDIPLPGGLVLPVVRMKKQL